MAKQRVEISASLRNDLGKGASRRLRREEKVPGVVYGAGKEPVSLTMEHKIIAKALENESFYSQILSLNLNATAELVILKDLQRHPFKPRITHVDFQRVKADEKLYMHVPFHFVGEDKAPGVKDDRGLVSHMLSDVEIACFPHDLPEFIEVDLSNMKLNDILHLSDLKLPKEIELVALSHGDDKAIVSVHIPRVEEEPEETAAPVAPTEVPAMAQKAENESKDSKK